MTSKKQSVLALGAVAILIGLLTVAVILYRGNQLLTSSQAGIAPPANVAASPEAASANVPTSPPLATSASLAVAKTANSPAAPVPSSSTLTSPALDPSAGDLGGDDTRATIRVGDREQKLGSNQVGDFPRVYVTPKAALPVRVAYPQGEVGEAVVVEVQDGGQVVETKSIVQVARLDDAKSLGFTFQVNEEPGIYRVSLRRGAELKTLQFWVGEPLPILSRADGNTTLR